MSPHLVFLTLFLGLISGPQSIDLQAEKTIHSIRILLNGRQLAELQQPPWHATVDLGSSILPGNLVAVGYDAHGGEIARVSQTINLPRPLAEFVIALQNDANGVPRSADLRWEHLLAAMPDKLSLTVDGKVVAVDAKGHARLPRLDMVSPHVLAASIHFADGFVARRELVVGGAIGDTADAQLTAIAVRQPGVQSPANPSDCFTSDGSPVRVPVVEKTPALVIFIIDPDPREATHALDPRMSPGLNGPGHIDPMLLASLEPDTKMRLLWPIAEHFKSTSNTSAAMFPPSGDVDAREGGLLWLLTRAYMGRFDENAPRQQADAAGVAGLDAIVGARRRAVVLVLGHQKDASSHNAASIREYLAAIGVPLFVWSLAGPRPDLHDAWGEVDDISSPAKLNVAAAGLRSELATQRVAWLATDAVSALRVQSTGRCDIAPLAHQP